MFMNTPTHLSPEVVKFPKGNQMKVSSENPEYLLRPELIESLFLLYQYTRDPIYVYIWCWWTGYDVLVNGVGMYSKPSIRHVMLNMVMVFIEMFANQVTCLRIEPKPFCFLKSSNTFICCLILLKRWISLNMCFLQKLICLRFIQMHIMISFHVNSFFFFCFCSHKTQPLIFTFKMYKKEHQFTYNNNHQNRTIKKTMKTVKVHY